MHNDTPLMAVAKLAALNAQQRFYELRFMWVTIQALEKLGVPTSDIEEMRGLYRAFADGVPFPEFVNQKKGADPTSQLPFS